MEGLSILSPPQERAAFPEPGALGAPLRTWSRCLVCGFTEIRTDEVIDRGIVLLAECPRCEHRWTERARVAPGEVRRAETEREVAA